VSGGRPCATLVVFPELGLSAYTCDDLFHQRALLEACEAALADVLAASRGLKLMTVVGLPLRVDHRLFNCAAVLFEGKILGVVPKTFLPNYAEYYEGRQFSAADEALSTQISLLGQTVPFGAQLVFSASDLPFFKLHVEICEDLWVPVPPSSLASLAGATVLVNLSASNMTVSKAGYRQQLVSQQSARCLAAYVYASAGPGESSTDMAWDGHAMIAENGELLAQSERFSGQSSVIFADLDLERVSRERMRLTSFGDSVRHFHANLQAFRTIDLVLDVPRDTPLLLNRKVAQFPYVPAHADLRDERCSEVFHIQVQALVQRLRSSGINKLVIGISGGLDSTHALMVCVKAMDQMGLPRTHLFAYTMPGYATSSRTLSQAHRLMASVGCAASEIDIKPSCEQMFKDLDHPFSEGHPSYDITFENVQAGERTNHLFRLANHLGAMVVGTGDLSELALGWCTYGVGDHMSHYNVNASVPKTLIRYLVRWVAETRAISLSDHHVLFDILDTQISPELVPTTGVSNEPGQRSEDTVGAYDLQDFNLYYILRFGFAPSKVAFLAYQAWNLAAQEADRVPLARIKATLGIFVSRFFKGSQFKRSCVPNGPKVGSGGSLSPRGDWRAPSDSESAPWLADLQQVPERADSS
jgi:NAD+ synthase (glutamine-hydrolysing)